MTLYTIADLEQGTEEWFAARRGMVTASVVGQLITVGTPDALTVYCPVCPADAGSPCLSTARKAPTPIKVPHSERSIRAGSLPPVYTPADNDTSRGLTALLVAERLTGFTDPTYLSNDMMRGIENEPRAIEVYSEHFAPVTTVGFMVEDHWGFKIGYSPDGLVGDDGLVEVKSRRQKNQLTTMLLGEIPAANMAQLQCGLLVSGRKWIDYISYCGGMPLWRKRVEPDEQWFAAIEAAVRKFEDTAKAMTTAFHEAAIGLPPTERVNNDLGLVF